MLSTEKVLAVWNGSWELEGERLEAIALPCHAGGVCGELLNTQLVDLEPVTRTVVVADVWGSRLGQVGEQWTGVANVVVDSESDGVDTGDNIVDLGGSGVTESADIASDVVGLNVLNWAVAVHHTTDVLISSSLLSIDNELFKVVVGKSLWDGASQGQNGEKSRLHVDNSIVTW